MTPAELGKVHADWQLADIATMQAEAAREGLEAGPDEDGAAYLRAKASRLDALAARLRQTEVSQGPMPHSTAEALGLAAPGAAGKRRAKA